MTLPLPGMRFENTGEDRPPRKGEWYWGNSGPAMADRDFDLRCLPILRRIDAGERCPEELEREREDQERRAALARERGTFLRRYEREEPPPSRTRVEDLQPLAETAPKVRRELEDKYLPYADSED